MRKTMKQIMIESIDESSSEKLRRRGILVDLGVKPEDAAIVDDAYINTMKRLFEVLGDCLEETNPSLWTITQPYIMRGLVSSLGMLEDAMQEGLVSSLVSNMVTVVVDDGTPPTPGCDCPVCMLKHMNREQDNATRH